MTTPMKRRLPSRRCLHVRRVVQTYLDGELDEKTASVVAEHLDECRRCGIEADAYRAIAAAITRSAAKADPAAVDRLRQLGAELARGAGSDAGDEGFPAS